MIKPSLPENENERLKSLKSYKVLDTPSEEEFDDITKIASYICDTPISLITLIDEKRQWFKSKHGLDVPETPREHAFCAHGILDPTSPLIVNNVFEDERFVDNPLATGEPHIEFYAGIPLVNDDDHALGSLCVIDHRPREISQDKIEVLKVLAKQVVKMLELKKTLKALAHEKKLTEQAKENLIEFGHMVAHDLKAPFRRVKSLTELLKADYEDQLNQEGAKLIQMIDENASHGQHLIEGLLRFSKESNYSHHTNEMVDIGILLDYTLNLIAPPSNFKINRNICVGPFLSSRVAIIQILQNLIVNAIKYNDKPRPEVTINALNKGDYNYIEVIDNGVGIPQNQLDRIFNLFTKIDQISSTTQQSHGVGLAIVKKLAESLGGSVQVSSKEGLGTNFTVKVPTHETD